MTIHQSQRKGLNIWLNFLLKKAKKTQNSSNLVHPTKIHCTVCIFEQWHMTPLNISCVIFNSGVKSKLQVIVQRSSELNWIAQAIHLFVYQAIKSLSSLLMHATASAAFITFIKAHYSDRENIVKNSQTSTKFMLAFQSQIR